MGTNLGSLGDFFKQNGTEQPCRIRGCKNTVRISEEQAMYGKTHGNVRNDGGKMCDSCWEFFNSCQDKVVPCSKPGCKGTWVWNRYQQLEAHVKGHDTPPRGFCDACRSQVKEKQDIEQPCRTHGCKNTWTWTARMQQESHDGKAPHRLCDECHKIWITLQDKELPCRVKGCKNHIVWNRYQQLEWIRSGKKLENPPKRMCNECFDKFSLLKPVEVPCRVTGCSHTWTWTPFDQLEAIVGQPLPKKEDKPAAPEAQEPVADTPAPAVPAENAAPVPAVDSAAPEAAPEVSAAPAAPAVEAAPASPFKLNPPKRMCPECFAFFNAAKDQEQPCANRGCEEKWVWTKAMQLAGHVHGHDQAPHRMCEKCQTALKGLKPIQEPCREADCHGTWTYAPEDQLKDSLLKRPPQGRHCPECAKFLQENQPQELTCEKCGEKFTWSVHEQLLTKLGTFQKPRFCAKCNTEELAAMPSSAPLIIPAAQTAFKVKMPVGGPWNDSPVTRDWPDGLTNERITAMENAAHRVVFLGDDLVADQENTPSLPSLLEASLNSTGDSYAVLNAGMRDCTTALGTARLARDVAAFAPETLIFSFAFADTMKRSDEAQADFLARLTAETEAFLDAVQALENPPKKIICWMPNPIYPQNSGNSAWKGNADPDVLTVNRYGSVLRNLKAICDRRQIAVADGKAIFDMQGQKTAMENMATWNRANAEGCKTHLRALLEAMKG